jgi:hypothetical protein
MRHIKSYLVTIALVVTIGITGAVQAAETSPATTQPSQSKKELRQLKSAREQIANVQEKVWACQTFLGEQKHRSQYDTWSYPQNVKYRLWVVKKWTSRLGNCKHRKAEYIEMKRQWNWQAFPQWIIDLARCETSINWYAEGSSSHGLFYSAFNIGRPRYDLAAHKMGVRGWNEGKGVPSPYEQAMAVIGYVRIYGDGFTGNCAGIARSSW